VTTGERTPAPVGGPSRLEDEDQAEETRSRSWLFERLRLRRFDLVAMAVLLAVAFVFRFFSPLMPDIFTGTGFISNCVHSTPIDARGDLGTLCGLAYPYQRANPQSGRPAEGEVFDEVYFAVFGHDDLKGIPYFDDKPPVARYLIAAGEWLYGDWRKVTQGLPGDPADLGFNTFGWRIMACIFGSLVVPLMYLLAFKLWPNRWFAIGAGVLCCFDGMFFIQSRIAMLDIFLVFFVMLAYTLFLFHLESRTERGAVASLLLMGIVLGVAIMCKWTALAALGSIAFFLVARPLASHVKLSSGGWSWGPRSGHVLPGRARLPIYAWTAVIALVAIPIAIDLVSWIPFFMRGQFHTLGDLLTYQYQGYEFNATLTATHPYGSKWYTWPLTVRPVLYYYQGDGLGVDLASGQQLVAGMTDLGNPLIWWASVPALLALPYFAIKDRSWPATVIMVGYVTAYLPLAKVSRVLFMFEYFGPLIFAVLALAFVLARMQQAWVAAPLGLDHEPALQRWVRSRWIVPVFLGLAVLTFLYFYPVWTGLPISYHSFMDGFWTGKVWLFSWI
jgi:dolichyl-phosphate-mannose-protein mannosyltransferase